MTGLFWRNFFFLLLVFVAVAEWSCCAWLLADLAGMRFSAPTHIAGPTLIYMANRLILSRPMPAPGVGLFLRRLYSASALASMFGFAFLLIVGVLWTVVRVGLVVAVTLGAAPLSVAAGFTDLAAAAATGGLLTIGCTIAYGYVFGQRRLWINCLEVEVPGLGARLDAMRLVQISDVHLGNFMPATAITHYVERINALNPDVIVITGDITDGLDHAPATFRALGGLRARLGVFAILGNHDVYTGADNVVSALRRYTDFTVLRDETAFVEEGGDRLYIIGLNDRGMDWARGVRRCRELDQLRADIPPGAPAILLSHRPDLFEQAARLGISLVLAGHTHGGQLAVPLLAGRSATLAYFMTRYPRGTYRSGASTLHVNLGLGVTGQPIRVASPREITSIRLRAPRPSPSRSSAAR